MRGSRPRALPPEATHTQQSFGRGEFEESRDAVAQSGRGDVRESQYSVAPSEGGEVRESQYSVAPSDVEESHGSQAPRRRKNQLLTNGQRGQVVNRRSSLGRVQRGTISPELIKSILDTAINMFAPEEELPKDTLEELARDAIASADGNYGIQEAVRWAAGFEFPQDLVDSDMRLFRAAQLDFSAMVRMRLRKIGGARMSAHRVELLRADNPERARLFDIAKGMRVPLPVGFVPNGKGNHTSLRPAYVEVHQAVDRMLADLHAQGLAFCLPKAEAIALIDGLHLGKASWTPKKGKASGRCIGDMSFCDGTPLNCEESKQIAESWWGRIELPTIDEMVCMILEFYREAVRIDPLIRWEDLRLWKTDLRGAYQLMSLHPEAAKYFGMEIYGERVFIHLCGIFGWTCTPAAFQVVSRGIQWELQHSLKGRCKMYVDDIVGVCLARDLDNEVKCAKDVCTSLLGPNAIAEDKTETGTRLDVLGYILDIERRLVSISRKNFLNAVYGFFTTNLDEKVSLKTAEKLASWGSRYSKICRAMRPFCGALHRATSGRKSRHALFFLPEETQRAIRGWRAMLYLVSFNEQRYTRRMESFMSETLEYVVEFDASLTGAGILWYKRQAQRWLWGAAPLTSEGSALGPILHSRTQLSTLAAFLGWWALYFWE